MTQTVTTVNRNTLNPDATWESNFQTRMSAIVNAKTYNPGGFSSPDDGKSRWTQLLCEMYKDLGNSTDLNTWMTTKGASYVNDQFGGSFCGPFSAPGLTHYFFQFKNVLPAAQVTTVENMLGNTKTFSYRCSPSTGWQLLMRPDRGMDPIWTDVGKPNEKNSENYHWMLRMDGYLFAEAYGDADTKLYFKNFVKNWIRALYNAGRVEWSSNNYFGHTFMPLLVLYMHAQDPDIKNMAKAGIDWMLTEEALHYIDGFQAGADVRAKTNAYQPFSGSTWGYNYLYFNDPNHQPTYMPLTLSTKTLDDYIGYTPYCDYRPAQNILDLAWRNYDLPVEIQSAKPFYAIDFGDYKNWKGDKDSSRRFEFETIWQDKNCTLSSLATNSPDGGFECLSQKSFWEQNLWRLAVKGSTNGAIQITGNAGYRTPIVNETTGRYKYEQIAQYRNVMLRTVREDTITKLWMIAPNTMSVEVIGNNVFADMGNDVYAAFTAYNVLSVNVLTYSKYTSYNQYNWDIAKNELGAVALEVGIKDVYGSYADFKTAIQTNSSFTRVSDDVIQHKSAANHTLKMQYMPVTTFNLFQGCNINVAGVTPKVWGDGKYIDYQTWDSYKVSFGKQIIKQQWGSGVLQLASNTGAMQITIDATTAIPTWGTFNTADAPVITTIEEENKEEQIHVYPNPANNFVTLDIDRLDAKSEVNVRFYNLSGKVVLNTKISNSQQIDIENFTKGFYLVEFSYQNQTYYKKLIKH